MAGPPGAAPSLGRADGYYHLNLTNEGSGGLDFPSRRLSQCITRRDDAEGRVPAPRYDITLSPIPYSGCRLTLVPGTRARV
jgi:hypothetical protein